jgi:4,4'-diaponeurosporenoate glycosyltransferase
MTDVTSPVMVVFVGIGLVVGLVLVARPRRLRAVTRSVAVPRVSVIIPARNEATRLPILLDSLRALDPPAHEIIVVDDESRDATSDIARAGGARVVVAGAVPAGWLGKPWACQAGADAATGSYLLFLDADTSLAPDALRVLFAALDGGVLSIAPFHETHAFHEQLGAFANLVSILGTGAFAIRPIAERPTVFGPCVLVARADYDRMGGHRAVHDSVVEDLMLARVAHDAGVSLTCATGGATVRYRMYGDGFDQMVESWTKNIARGATLADPVSVVAAAWWVAACAAVAGWMLGGLAELAAHGAVPVVAFAAWAVVAAEVRWLLRRIGSYRRWTAVLFVIPLAFFLAVFAGSVARRGFRLPVHWRGRRVDERALRAH